MFKKETKSTRKMICNSCNKKCLGEVLRVNDKYFHNQCFLCSVCNVTLSTDGYFQKNKSYFCVADYQKLFGHKCSTCCKYIEGEMVLIMDKSYHIECFNCSNCKQILEDGSRIINVGEEILCEDCIVCDEIADIDEHENTYDSLVWHPEDTTNSSESNVSYPPDEKCFSYLSTDQSFLRKPITPYGKTQNLSHFHRPAKVQSSIRRLSRKNKFIDPIIKMSRYPDGKNNDESEQIEMAEPLCEDEEISEKSHNRTGMLSLLSKKISGKSNRKFKQDSFDVRTASKYPSGSPSLEQDMDFYDERDVQQPKMFADLDATSKLSSSDFSSGKLENSDEYSVSLSDSSFYSIPYQMLVTTNKRLPDNIDRCNLERHLSDVEFSEVLKCSRIDFYTLPLWKRNDLKRKALIF